MNYYEQRVSCLLLLPFGVAQSCAKKEHLGWERTIRGSRNRATDFMEFAAEVKENKGVIRGAPC